MPDLLGHGFSSVPDDAKAYNFNRLLRDVLTIFDHYVYEGRPCAVIAHSYGCSFAVALARYGLRCRLDPVHVRMCNTHVFLFPVPGLQV